ncbi:MAG: Gfo/Idh/MocA family oxidoreductase [Leptolyngbya sp. SIO1E4]|nr:Gfo/Idh/MocA family oxidoreductase [Leptolyngbya sp. SIO1E4]
MRAEALQADPRAQLVAVVGNSPEKTQAFAQTHGQTQEIAVSQTWQTLIEQAEIDLVVVCHVNQEHGAVVRSALLAGKSVVVEYPLSLSAAAAADLIALAQQQRSLLHVEHIELLGGLHQAMQAQLPYVGTPAYVRYCTTVAQHPAPQKWTYDAALFGFPLAGALSRIHRLTNLFGAVHQVSCSLQYDGVSQAVPTGYFKNCRCIAQLQFRNGTMAEVLYAKGEQTWRSQRWMEVEGDRGALLFEGNGGTFISAAGSRSLEVGSRKGLFAKDTTAVLDALYDGTPLYVTPQESLYALQVAAAAEQSAQTGKTVTVSPP